MALIKFNNEQSMIQGEVRKFVLQEIEPIAQDIEKNEKIPEYIFKKLAELGLLSPTIPVEFSGARLDTTSLCIIIEELSKAYASIGLIVSVNALLTHILMRSAQGRYEEYLNRLAQGAFGGYDLGGGGNGMEFGSNGSLKLAGRRRFILNGELAEFFVLLLNTEREKGIYLVDRDALKIKTTKVSLLGLKCAGIVDLLFDNFEIPKEACLIDGSQYESAMEIISAYLRLCLCAISLGIAEAALDASIKYSKERKQFGRPICEFPMVREMIAEMKIKIEAARNLLYDTANRIDGGEDYRLASAIACAIGSEAAVYCGVKSVQVFGGYGYTKDYPVERYLRDAKSIQSLAVPVALKENIAKIIID